MEQLTHRRNRTLHTWLLARSAELREDLREARRAFQPDDLRRHAAEAIARTELDSIDNALARLGGQP